VIPVPTRRSRRCISIILPLLACGTVGRTAPAPPEVSLPLMPLAPKIDGEIDEQEWARATKLFGFVSQHDGKLTVRDGMFWIGCDGKQLFTAVKTEMPPGAGLLTRAVPDGDRDIIEVTRDDSIELWIDPHKGQTEGDRRLFQIIVNARGVLYDRSYDMGNQQNPVDVTWRIKWEFADKVTDGWWQAEFAIPLTVLGAETDLGHPWGLRVVRDWHRPWDQSRWASTGGAFDDVPSMPVVHWDPQAPVVQMRSLHKDHKEAVVAVSLHNPGAAPLTAKVFLGDAWSMDPPRETERSVTVAPGKTEVVSHDGRDGGPEGSHHTVIRVTSPADKRVFFFRDFTWNMHRPEAAWTLEKEQSQAVEFRFKYYPYHNKVKAQLDLTALAAREAVTGAKVVVRAAKTETSLAEQAMAVKDGLAEAVFAVPALADGDYEIAAFLAGGAGVPKAPVVRTFARKHFPWEHNTLGTSAAVIPPFTPLMVSGNELSCVLRELKLGGGGLWDQARSEGQELLAAPMRWEVQADGKPVKVQTGALKVASAAPNRVVAAGGWEAGSLTAAVRSEYDYDGMMKVTLSLTQQPTPETMVERVSLVVPLRNDAVKYMHTCGDGLRHNYAGKVPAGEGVVWDSSKGNKLNIIGTFYPYVHLGGGERGLCWFADNDRDWVLDDTTPTVQVVRNGGVVELRVHFVTQPTKLTRTHNVEFGLQATPVKPMPEQPMNWRKWRCGKKLAGCFPLTILGSTFYWGGIDHDVYPRDCDLSIYDWIRDTRENGKADLDFVKRWMEGYKPEAQPGTPEWQKYDAHIMYTARVAPSYPRAEGCAMIPYTNARGIGFQAAEWPTFQDEWINFPYYNRVAKGGVGYDITPTDSYRDFALYYYQKAMTCFDGVYWDNVYMAALNDAVTSAAWVDERGRLHPSMGLWHMRELIRRTAVMYHEQGKHGVFIPHMTNTNLVPTLAFANVALDWEWQYGDRDFQDRFSPDLTVAQTLGRQTGCVPLILSGGLYDRSNPKFPWAMRTRLGVCLVHELRVWDYGPEEEVALLKKLHEFGYGEPDCQVFNYWDDGHPVAVTGTEAKTIALSRGGKAVVVVTDYGDGGDCTVKLEAAKLGVPTAAKATDLETGKAITGDLANGFTFALKKNDFGVLLVE